MNSPFSNVLAFGLGLTLLPAAAMANPERFESQRPDGSTIHWNLDKPSGAEKAGMIVLAQGSGCLSVEHSTNLALIRAVFPEFAALMVEKYGVNPGDNPQNDHEDCSVSFREHHTMTQRVKDYLTVIDSLRDEDWWDGTLVLIGGSEGGGVAARLAAPANADAAILISTGGGKTFGQMVRQSIMEEMARNAVPEEHWPPVDEMFARARENPLSSEVWGGASYRFWADAIDHRIMDSMLQSDAEFLLIQGGKDTSTPVELARIVADTFAEAGRCNLTYWEFPGFNHGMADVDGNGKMAEVLSQAATWLRDRVSVDRQGTCLRE